MADVKVTELRQNLPSYLARVRRGERLRITTRGKVIAELAPAAAQGDEASVARARLRGSVLGWTDPLASAIAAQEWELER